MKAYIAIGHGRRPDGSFDPGAVSGDHSEQRDAVPVVEACTQVLRDNGVEVISEAEDEDDPNFWRTTSRANAANVDCVVSFHYDWSGAPPGAFMIATTDEARKLGTAIEKRVAEAGFDIRDYPDDRDGLYLLDNSNAPAVIFECGRIGHEAIDETAEQRDMGEAAGYGVLDYLGVDMEDSRIPDYLVETLEDLHEGRRLANDGAGINHDNTRRKLADLFTHGVTGGGLTLNQVFAAIRKRLS